MPRPPATIEERVIKALRVARAITGPEQDEAIAALSATEACTNCNGTGNARPDVVPPYGCARCENTGQQYVIR